MSELVPRHAQALVIEALADTRVILVNGARQSGKSTLTRLASAGIPDTTVRLLDDPATLRAAQDEPTDFVEHDGLMVIDEIQLVPELLRPIKVRVDLDPAPGDSCSRAHPGSWRSGLCPMPYPAAWRSSNSGPSPRAR
ncbi:MAG: AAA family ATPase [Propionibacteriaceae bacterium]